MNEILQQIVDFIKLALRRQKYGYQFLTLDGKEPNKQIKIANSIEYEFINSGNSYVKINNSITLYPYFMGIEPVRIKMTCSKNEMDMNVYEYEFKPIEKGDPVLGFINSATKPSNALIGYDNTFAVNGFNKLQVIIKQIKKD